MKTKFILFTAILFLPLIGISQTVNDEIQLIQSAFGMEKRALVTEYMNLSEAEAAAFWPVYQQYEEERRANARERIKIVSDYAENFENLNDSMLDDLVKRRLKVDSNRTKLHAKYYKRFKKATSATTAAKFLQLDDYLQSTILLALMEGIPFIGEK